MTNSVPQPNTWNNTKQHLVSQFLLKGFGCKGNARMVYVLDNETGTIDLGFVKELASQMNLLTALDDHRRTRAEQQASSAIQRIRKGKLDLSIQHRKALDRFVFILMVTDPYAGVNKSEMRETVIKDVSQEFAETAIRQGLPIDREHLEVYLEGLMPRDYLDVILESGSGLVLMILHLMGLTVHKAKKPVVLGDSAVIPVRRSVNGKPSLLNHGSEVLLPISSNYVLVYSWANPTNVIQRGNDLTPQQITTLGQAYYHFTQSRYLFGRTSEALRSAQMDPHVPDSDGTVTPHNDGWLVMQEIAKQTEIAKVVEDRERRRRLEERIKQLALRGEDRILYELMPHDKRRRTGE